MIEWDKIKAEMKSQNTIEAILRFGYALVWVIVWSAEHVIKTLIGLPHRCWVWLQLYYVIALWNWEYRKDKRNV